MAENKNNVIDFELFKGQKELDNLYSKYLGNVERTFDSKTSPRSMLQRLYYTIRYLEGTINGLDLLFLLTRQDMASQKEGINYMISWLEDIIARLKEYQVKDYGRDK